MVEVELPSKNVIRQASTTIGGFMEESIAFKVAKEAESQSQAVVLLISAQTYSCLFVCAASHRYLANEAIPLLPFP